MRESTVPGVPPEGAFRCQHSLNHCRKQSRRRALTGYVPHYYADGAARQIDKFKKIAADGTAWDRVACGLTKATIVLGLSHEHSLQVRGSFQFAVEARFLEAFHDTGAVVNALVPDDKSA